MAPSPVCPQLGLDGLELRNGFIGVHRKFNRNQLKTPEQWSEQPHLP